jgi:hypothetical protein
MRSDAKSVRLTFWVQGIIRKITDIVLAAEENATAVMVPMT